MICTLILQKANHACSSVIEQHLLDNETLLMVPGILLYAAELSSLLQLTFKAWYKKGATGRTTLVIAFKRMVLTESGQLKVPPNCTYADAEQRRSKAVSVETIKLMVKRRYPLSCGLLSLVGKEQGSYWEMAAARRLEARKRRGPAVATVSSSSTTRQRAESGAFAILAIGADKEEAGETVSGGGVKHGGYKDYAAPESPASPVLSDGSE
eukprot:1924438-Pleurochrysis_carterae.AAC.4